MSRSIITAQPKQVVHNAFPELLDDSPLGALQSPQNNKSDGYRERLFKYIPAEVITLYLCLSTMVASTTTAPHFLYWVIFISGLIGTPAYLFRLQNVTSPLQLTISTLAFAVWVFALGGPFVDIPGYKQIYGGVLLPIFTFFIAIIVPAPLKR